MKKIFKSSIKSFDIIALLFSVFWIVILLFDYLNKHPVYFDSIVNFRYSGLILFFIVLGVSWTWLIHSKAVGTKKKNLLIPLTVLTFPISIIAMVFAYDEYYASSIVLEDYLHLLGLSFYVISAVFILLFSCYCFGVQLSQKLLVKKIMSKSHYTIDLSIGIILVTFLLFILGSMHFLNFWTCALLIFLPIGVNYKVASEGFKNIWSYNPDFSKFQLAILFTCGIFCVLQFVFILGPYPLGFDSRNYYLNIPKLIAENNGLVRGFQPYNWELFMSVGLVLFKKMQVSMLLSQIGGVLASASAYALARSYIKLNKTHALLISLLILITPAISRHMYIELKVDLALLYFQLVTIHIFLSHLLYKNKTRNSHIVFSVVLGVFLGYGLGLKLLHFFLIFGLFVALSLDKRKVLALGFIILIGLGLVFLLRLDEQTGLRSYHKNVDLLSYVLIALGLFCGGILLYKDFQKGKKLFTQLGIILFTTIFTFSPWVVKTYYETGRTDLLGLIRGSGGGHHFDNKKITEIYNKMIEGENE